MVNTVNALAEAAPSSNSKAQASTEGSRDAFRKYLDAARTQGNDNTNKLSVKKASRMKQIDQGWESLKNQPESDQDGTSDTDALMEANPAIMNMAQGIVNILEAFGYLGGKVDEKALLGEISQLLNNALPQGIYAKGNPDTALRNNDRTQSGNGWPIQQSAADIAALLESIQTQQGDLQETTLQAENQETANANILPGYMKKAIEKIIREYASQQAGHEPVNENAAPATNADAAAEKALSGNDLLMWMLKAALKEKGGATKAAADPSQSVNETRTGTENVQTAAAGDALKQPVAAADNQADVQTAESLKSTAKETRENIMRIIDRMQASVNEGKQEFTVQLKPEYLGRLSIKLVMNSDGISAHIRTADLGTHGLISDQLNALQQAMKDKGINLVNMDVKYDATAFDMGGFQQERQNWDWNGGRKNVRYAYAPDLPIGSLGYDATAEDQRLAAYNHSVEFKA